MNEISFFYLVTDAIFASNDDYGRNYRENYRDREESYDYPRYEEEERVTEDPAKLLTDLEKSIQDLEVIESHVENVRRYQAFKEFINATIQEDIINKKQWLDIFMNGGVDEQSTENEREENGREREENGRGREDNDRGRNANDENDRNEYERNEYERNEYDRNKYDRGQNRRHRNEMNRNGRDRDETDRWNDNASEEFKGRRRDDSDEAPRRHSYRKSHKHSHRHRHRDDDDEEENNY